MSHILYWNVVKNTRELERKSWLSSTWAYRNIPLKKSNKLKVRMHGLRNAILPDYGMDAAQVWCVDTCVALCFYHCTHGSLIKGFILNRNRDICFRPNSRKRLVSIADRSFWLPGPLAHRLSTLFPVEYHRLFTVSQASPLPAPLQLRSSQKAPKFDHHLTTRLRSRQRVPVFVDHGQISFHRTFVEGKRGTVMIIETPSLSHWGSFGDISLDFFFLKIQTWWRTSK